MDTENLDDAKDSLRIREGIKKENGAKIASIDQTDKSEEPIKKTIIAWAQLMKVDSVIWTDLKPRFKIGNKYEEQAPAREEAINYLNGLHIHDKQHAEEYIRKAPRQIDTDYRQAFEKEFGWTYLE